MSPLCICAQSCLTLWDSMDCSLPGLSVHGISQARILEWVATSSSRGSSQPRDQICVSCVSGTERWILYQGTIRLVFKADIFPSALLGALESLLGFSGSVFVDAPLLAGSPTSSLSFYPHTAGIPLHFQGDSKTASEWQTLDPGGSVLRKNLVSC